MIKSTGLTAAPPKAATRALLSKFLVPGQAGHQGEVRRGARETPGKKVPRDLPAPHRLLEDRPAVVRAHLTLGRHAHLAPPIRAAALLGHRDLWPWLPLLLAHLLPPINAASTPAAKAPAATAAGRHRLSNLRVTTSGSGGKP